MTKQSRKTQIKAKSTPEGRKPIKLKGKTVTAPARLIISESEQGADMLHATGFRAPDAFVYLESRGQSAVLLSDLEVDRGKREARVDEVVSSSELERAITKRTGARPTPVEVIVAFLTARGGMRPVVPADFPLGLARELERCGIEVTPVAGMFRPEREIKTEEEVKLMTQATRITEAGMERVLPRHGPRTWP